MIEEVLASLNLDALEAKVYLHLVQTGSQPAGRLARDLGLPRPTVYGTLGRLQDVGLVSESSAEAVKVFVPEPPEKIGLLLEDRAGRLEKHREELAILLPTIKTAVSAALLRPTFRLYEGTNELIQAMRDMLLYSNLETLAFWPIRDLVEVFPEGFVRDHNRSRIRNNLSIRAIWPRSHVVSLGEHPYLGSRKELLRQLRLAPAGVDASMGYWIYGNKVIFLSSRRENIGFVIESAEMIELLTVHFELLWRASTPTPDNPDPTDLKTFLAEV